jgi:hypothetical protein
MEVVEETNFGKRLKYLFLQCYRYKISTVVYQFTNNDSDQSLLENLWVYKLNFLLSTDFFYTRINDRIHDQLLKNITILWLILKIRYIVVST